MMFGDFCSSPISRDSSAVYPALFNDKNEKFQFLGSDPDRGRSPVEWGDFPSVHSFVHTPAWLDGPQTWLGGPQTWLYGPQTWLGGPQT